MGKFYTLIGSSRSINSWLLSGLFFIAFGFFGNTSSEAQVVLNENFAAGSPLPLNWQSAKASGVASVAINKWERFANSASCPVLAGGGICIYNSKNLTSAGESAILVSPAYDMSARGVGVARVRLDVYRDCASSTEQLTMWVNNTPTLTGATQLVGVGTTPNNLTINCLAAPAAAGWNSYTWNIPAAVTGGLWSTTYIMVRGYASGAAVCPSSEDILVDNFSIDTYPSNMVLGATGMSSQNISTVASGSTNAEVIGIEIVAVGSANRITLDSVLFNANGTTNLANITNAKLYSTGSSPFFSTTTQYGTTVAAPGATPVIRFNDNIVPRVELQNGSNYFWLTYDVAGPAGNCVDADFIGIYTGRYVGGAGPNAMTFTAASPATAAGCRDIGVAYCIPIYTVGTAWAGYTNNDYVAAVEMFGEVPGPAINNSTNTNGPPGGSANCLTPPFCQFAAHPPDYEEFPPTPTTTMIIQEGKTYVGQRVQVGKWFSSNYIAVFIDWNGDGDFCDFIGGQPEKVHQSASLSNDQWTTFTITVPASATGVVNGNTRLRVREVYARSNILPFGPCVAGSTPTCTSPVYTYGETEDYTITITPNCAPPPNKQWLGFNSDWDDPGNWCDGIPTLTDNVYIPGIGPPSNPAYIRPIIGPGDTALCNNLNIGMNYQNGILRTDTLFIDASKNSYLQVDGNINIGGNPTNPNAAIVVNTDFSGAPSMGNGLFNIKEASPFREGSVFDLKMQLVYTATELAAAGMEAGDVINSLCFDVQTKQTVPGNAFTAFEINYHHTSATEHNGFSMPPIVGAKQTIHTSAAFNTVAGTNTVALNGPAQFIWNGTDNVVLELCYDRSGITGNSGGLHDIILSSQTTGRKSTLAIEGNLNYPFSVGPTIPWTPSGCTYNYSTDLVAWVGGVQAPTYHVLDKRINLTFKFDRPYQRYPISLTGDWVNFGKFIPAHSVVKFDGNGLQNITGTSITNFGDLELDNTVGVGNPAILMQIDANVNDSIILQTGQLHLNRRVLTMKNDRPSSVVRTAPATQHTGGGMIVSEEPPLTPLVPSYGLFAWDIALNQDEHVFPMGTSAGVYIPFYFDPQGGDDVGTVSLATFNTAIDNTPFANTVWHMSSFNNSVGPGGPWIDNSDYTVDRFWDIDVSGTIGSVQGIDVKFSYVYATEELQPGFQPGATKLSHRWELATPGGGGWQWHGAPVAYQAIGPPAGFGVRREVPANGVNQFSPWAITKGSEPLPIELLDFTARAEEDRVKISWSTASEIDVDKFVVHRTIKGNDFSFIDQIKSAGNSTSVREYETYDENPVNGLQYYRLETNNIDGSKEYSELVPVVFSDGGDFDITSLAVNQGSSMITINFIYNSTEPVDYIITDKLGKVIAQDSRKAAHPGSNSLEVYADYSSGVYFISLMNNDKVISDKVMY